MIFRKNLLFFYSIIISLLGFYATEVLAARFTHSLPVSKKPGWEVTNNSNSDVKYQIPTPVKDAEGEYADIVLVTCFKKLSDQKVGDSIKLAPRERAQIIPSDNGSIDTTTLASSPRGIGATVDPNDGTFIYAVLNSENGLDITNTGQHNHTYKIPQLKRNKKDYNDTFKVVYFRQEIPTAGGQITLHPGEHAQVVIISPSSNNPELWRGTELEKIVPPGNSQSANIAYKKRLFVGEGMFSYTASLLEKHPELLQSITATELSTRPKLESSGDREDFLDNIAYIERIASKQKVQANIEFGVDACELHKRYAKGRFKSIHFSFPFVGKGAGVFYTSDLFMSFFTSASQIQEVGDQIHVILINAEGDQYWKDTYADISKTSLSAGYQEIKKRHFKNRSYQVESEDGGIFQFFDGERYPGYNHAVTVGNDMTAPGLPKMIRDGVEHIFKKVGEPCRETYVQIRGTNPPQAFDESSSDYERECVSDSKNDLIFQAIQKWYYHKYPAKNEDYSQHFRDFAVGLERENSSRGDKLRTLIQKNIDDGANYLLTCGHDDSQHQRIRYDKVDEYFKIIKNVNTRATNIEVAALSDTTYTADIQYNPGRTPHKIPPLELFELNDHISILTIGSERKVLDYHAGTITNITTQIEDVSEPSAATAEPPTAAAQASSNTPAANGHQQATEQFASKDVTYNQEVPIDPNTPGNTAQLVIDVKTATDKVIFENTYANFANELEELLQTVQNNAENNEEIIHKLEEIETQIDNSTFTLAQKEALSSRIEMFRRLLATEVAAKISVDERYMPTTENRLDTEQMQRFFVNRIAGDTYLESHSSNNMHMFPSTDKMKLKSVSISGDYSPLIPKINIPGSKNKISICPFGSTNIQHMKQAVVI